MKTSFYTILNLVDEDIDVLKVNQILELLHMFSLQELLFERLCTQLGML